MYPSVLKCSFSLNRFTLNACHFKYRTDLLVSKWCHPVTGLNRVAYSDSKTLQRCRMITGVRIEAFGIKTCSNGHKGQGRFIDVIRSTTVTSDSKQCFANVPLIASKPRNYPKGSRVRKTEKCHETVVSGQASQCPSVRQIYFNLFQMQRKTRSELHTGRETEQY